jgi:quinol monooxygenase YgiN
MRALLGLFSLIAISGASVAPSAAAEPIFDVAHLDVLPVVTGNVDFLQQGYSLLFKYRDLSMADEGLRSFRVLNLIQPSNHSEIIQEWASRQAYEHHLGLRHTIEFRFGMQGDPKFGSACCVGSPIDDRLYRLVRSFGLPWSNAAVPATVGPAGALFVISYVEFLPHAQPKTESEDLNRYGEASTRNKGPRALSFSVLQQLDRPNRYAMLEVWDNQKNYDAWRVSDTSREFATNIRSLLDSPIDRRVTILCGETLVDNVGCVSRIP